MLSIRRRLIGEYDDIREIIFDARTLLAECHGLNKLLWLALVLNPVVWVIYFGCKWTFALIGWIRDLFPRQIDFDELTVDIPTSWLVRRVTVQEAEAENSSFPERRIVDGVPFGFCNDYWRCICDYMEPDDELWYYQSTDNEIVDCGYVVLRGSKPVAAIKTCPD